jgi:hypothetical protein
MCKVEAVEHARVLKRGVSRHAFGPGEEGETTSLQRRLAGRCFHCRGSGDCAHTLTHAALPVVLPLAGLFAVGPASVGATPGPVCYSKGGTILAITDCNVVLGRIQPQFFPAIFGPHVRLCHDHLAYPNHNVFSDIHIYAYTHTHIHTYTHTHIHITYTYTYTYTHTYTHTHAHIPPPLVR